MGLAHEVTKQNSKQLSYDSFKANAILKAAVPKKDIHGKSCSRCTGKGHKPDDCGFKEVECQACKKKAKRKNWRAQLALFTEYRVLTQKNQSSKQIVIWAQTAVPN